jgi:hypothetical protein
MSYEPWPSPDAPRGPLPRLDQLPVAEQGYDQEAVREAFDSFYRHAAQLDASLKALEAVDAFQRDAWELRNDLRALRSFGYGDVYEPDWTRSLVAERRSWDVPSAVPRLALEAAFIVAVAVIAGVAHFRAWLIVALMAAAWMLVGLIEWIAARARFAVPASVSLPPAPVSEDTASWQAPAEVVTEAEAMTMVAPADAAPEPVEVEPEPELPATTAAKANGDVAEAAQPRKRWFRRASEEEARQEEAVAHVAEPPSHVRVVGSDPWEQ